MDEVKRPDSQMEQSDEEVVTRVDGDAAMDLESRDDVITGVRRSVEELEAGLTDAEDFYTATVEEQVMIMLRTESKDMEGLIIN